MPAGKALELLKTRLGPFVEREVKNPLKNGRTGPWRDIRFPAGLSGIAAITKPMIRVRGSHGAKPLA